MTQEASSNQSTLAAVSYWSDSTQIKWNAAMDHHYWDMVNVKNQGLELNQFNAPEIKKETIIDKLEEKIYKSHSAWNKSLFV